MINARAVRIMGPGDESVLEITDLEVRDPGAGEIRVAVAAAGLNRADLLQRQGFYPAPTGLHPVEADIPGLEYAGTVEAVGLGVTDPKVGDSVMGIVPGAAMATSLVTPARAALPVPDGMSLEHAAAIPEVFITAFDALFVQAVLRPSEVVLVHAVASGVGTAALQLALRWGARVVGTSRSAEKLARCAELGLEHVVHVEDGTFAEAARTSAGAPANVVLDFIGGQYLAENMKALAPRGRLIVVGLLGGAKGTLPLGPLLAKRAQIIGTVLRSRPPEENILLAQRFRREVLPFFASGALRPIVDDILPMAEIRQAHQRMAANQTFGKLVMRW